MHDCTIIPPCVPRKEDLTWRTGDWISNSRGTVVTRRADPIVTKPLAGFAVRERTGRAQLAEVTLRTQNVSSGQPRGVAGKGSRAQGAVGAVRFAGDGVVVPNVTVIALVGGGSSGGGGGGGGRWYCHCVAWSGSELPLRGVGRRGKGKERRVRIHS